jgi:hypothetical protein
MQIKLKTIPTSHAYWCREEDTIPLHSTQRTIEKVENSKWKAEITNRVIQ